MTFSCVHKTQKLTFCSCVLRVIMPSRKRTFSDLNESASDKKDAGSQELPSKKVKLEVDRSIKTRFLNSKDHKACIKYLQSIEESDLIQSLQIPQDVNREIAEYTTGLIKECGNKDCKAGICVLNEAMVNFENGKETEWNYCVEKDIFFCSLCKPSTVKFICCDTVQYVTDDTKCDGSVKYDDGKTRCFDEVYNKYSMRWKCQFCDDSDSEFDNDNSRTCRGCGKWMCYFHRETHKCPNAEHNIYCNLFDLCVKCDEWYCEGCQGPDGAVICAECQDLYCEKDWGDGYVCSCFKYIYGTCIAKDKENKLGQCDSEFCADMHCSECYCDSSLHQT